jgi:hypothetical protein
MQTPANHGVMSEIQTMLFSMSEELRKMKERIRELSKEKALEQVTPHSLGRLAVQ